MKTICVMTGTRAEYGLLRNLLFQLQADKGLALQLLVTGTHLSTAHGNTQDEIIRDGFSFDAVPIPVESDSKYRMAKNTGEALSAFADYFAAHRPDMLVLLGDRYEAFAAAAAAYIQSIPLAHISGGDVTEGALDDAFRHCITKMSALHFPGCADSAKRLIQMGEQPDTVYSVGDPGVENCLQTEFLSVQELSENLQFPLCEKQYGVVTFHPVTQEANTAEAQVRCLIAAMDRHADLQYIITLANADAGGKHINDIWKTAAKSHPNWYVVPSLGVLRYLSAVKHACVVLGNSSSGVIEAPALGVPTVNIGDRQKGRPIADSVLCCPPEAQAIEAAIAKARTAEFQALAADCDSPFGKGNTASEIVRILKDNLENNKIQLQKGFFDLPFQM